MKDFRKGYGWHVKCLDGPTGPKKGWWFRSWGGFTDPAEEANNLPKRIPFPDLGGWYEKQACRKKDGSLKEITHKKIPMIDWEYRWKQIREIAA